MALDRWRAWIREHRLTCAGAALVAGLSALPYARPLVQGASLYPYFQEAESDYAAVLRRFAEDPRAGDVWLFEHRAAPFPYPRFPFRVAAAGVALLGLDLFMIACDVVAPVLAFLAAAFLASELFPGRARLVALFAFAYVVLFGALPEYVSRVPSDGPVGAAKRMAALLTHFATPSVEIARAPFNALSVAPFVVTLALLLRLARGRLKEVWVAAPLAAFLVAFRTLPGVYLAGFAGYLSLFALRDRKPAEAKRLAAVAAAALLVLLLMLVEVSAWESKFPEQAARSGVFHTRSFSTGHVFPGAWALVPLLPALAGLLKGAPAELRRFGPGTALCTLALAHAGVVTGRTGFVHHLEGICQGPFVLPLLLTVPFLFLHRPRSAAIAGSAAVAALLLYAAPRFYFAVPYLKTYDEALLRELAPLRSRPVVRPRSVVAADPGFFEIYQDAHVLVPACGPFSAASDAEIAERLLCFYRLFDVPPDRVRDILADPERDPVCAQALHTFAWTRRRQVPGDAARWMEFYEALPRDPARLIPRIRERFRLDYVVVTPHVRALGGDDRRLRESPALREAYRSRSVAVYEALP